MQIIWNSRLSVIKDVYLNSCSKTAHYAQKYLLNCFIVFLLYYHELICIIQYSNSAHVTQYWKTEPTGEINPTSRFPQHCVLLVSSLNSSLPTQG